MFASVEELFLNPRETFLSSSEILLKYIDNILRHPTDMKFRRVRVGNALVERHLLLVPGGMECLFDMGFQEDGEYMTLAINSPLANVRKMKEELNAKRQTLLSNVPSTESMNTSSTESTSVSSTESMNVTRGASAMQSSPVRQHSQVVSPALLESEVKFGMEIVSNFNRVLIYENRRLQDKARAAIPREVLQRKAEARITDGISKDLIRDLYLVELLAWFKSFFSWTDCLPCSSCQGKTSNAGMLDPNPEEQLHGAARVENHYCTACNLTNRFPRYNDPGRLLEMRTGRCGEWANCFTLCCRAEGFEARHVVDRTDHVWTEVFSVARQRWIHCDPCENVSDQPLLYEVGWGKKLSYVIAFSCDDIQDVTWRYTSRRQETLSRRDECREPWLVALIMNLRADRQKSFPAAKRRLLVERTAAELVEFMLEPSADGQNLGGRTTGSLDWRISRGEIGSGVSPAECFSSVVISPTEEEVKRGFIKIRYSCVKDLYVRGETLDDELRQIGSGASSNAAGGKFIAGFKSLAYEATNVDRKVEHDWKKAYIARSENSGEKERGIIGWKFDLKDHGIAIDWIQIKTSGECFSSGRISWRLCGDSQCIMLNDEMMKDRMTELRGSSMAHLCATLSGGEGAAAWQHAQLFRQEVDENNVVCPLVIIIHFKTV